MESIADRIKQLRAREKLTQEAFAERLAGVSRGAVGNWERGEGIKRENLQAIAETFGVDLNWLASGRGELVVSPAPPRGYRPAPEFLGERDLPVFAAVEGGSGEMVVSTDPIDIVQRPWFLGTVKDGYAVLVTGESMEPAFRSGDLAIVNPRLGPQPSTDVLLIADERSGEFRASIKYLIKHEPHRWYLRQHNPPPGEPRDFWRSRKEWPKALRVVGKYSGR